MVSSLGKFDYKKFYEELDFTHQKLAEFKLPQLTVADLYEETHGEQPRKELLQSSSKATNVKEGIPS